MKTTLLVGASALAFILATPGAALADGECGNPDVSSDPNIVSCVSDPGRYPAGITYNQANYATPAGLRLDLYGTLIVTATSPAAVRAIGSADQAAIITARTGSRFTAPDTGLSATTTGIGLASVDNRGSVSAGLTGMVATADLTGGTGLGTVRNQSDGTITLTQANVAGAAYGMFARGGSASATNNGTITATSATAGAGTIYGIAGETHAAGGTMTLLNTNAVTLRGAPNLVGMASTGSTGAVSITNLGIVGVTSQAGNATGFLVAGGGTAGAVTATNNGTLAISAANAATGMDVEQGSSVTLVAQRTGATGGMSVTGGSATGFLVNNATGAVSVQNTGFVQQVTAATGAATGVAVAGGTEQNVRFADAVIGGTTYKADLVVTGPGTARGVSLAGGTGAVSVDFAGAALAVSSTGAGASGITVSGGSDVTIGTTINSATGNGAALAVNAAGGSALGVGVSQASGAESVTLRDSVTIANSGGAATGIAMRDGASQTVSLAKGAKVSGIGATGVTMTGATGAVTLNSAAALTVDGGTGGATGIEIGGGTAQSAQVNGALAVTAAGGAATGVTLQGGQSASLTLAADFTVANTSGDATGIVNGNPAAAVQLAKGMTVSATGAASGVRTTGGVTLSPAAAITVTASGEARGVDFDSAAAATTLHLPTKLTVTSASADAYGIVGRTGAGLTLDGAGTIDVHAGGNAIGIYTMDQSAAQNVAVDTVTARSDAQAAGGIVMGGSAGMRLTANTVTAAATTGGVGVLMLGTGAASDVQATLGTVTVTGANGAGVMLMQANGANVQAAVNSVTASGDGMIGVSASAAGNGSVALTIGRAATSGGASAQAVAVNGVSTTGANGTGVTFSVVDGAGSVVNNGSITTTGADAIGISGTATGNGSLAVTSASVTTSGSGAHGIALMGGTGAQTIAAQTVTVSGAGAKAISATSTAGAITVQSGTLAAQQGSSFAIGAGSDSGAITVTAGNSSSASADAIHLTSTSGAITVTLADGGATRSGAGAGLFVDTGGTATINLGGNATTATLQGATAGLSSRAAGGQTVTLAGTVGADAGPAVALAGGAATLVNRGVINGRIAAATSSLAFTNAGTWNAAGSSSFGGNAVLTNNGTINIAAGASAATVTQFSGLTSLRNGGTISLANGRVGDVLDLGGASFVGASGSRVVLDANLGGVAVNGAAPQSADTLRVGAASGTTTLVVRDVSGAEGAQFNFTGVRLVNAASATANAFVLDGGSINKGFAQYQLLADAAGNLNLVGLPTAQAFALVRTGAEVRRYWRRSGDAWAEQMRASTPKTGLSVWGQLHGGEETNRSRPVYTETVLGAPTRFTPNLDVRDSWTGGQLGLDWGQGDWSVGVTGGYLHQQGRLTAAGDQLKLNGGNLGVYLRYGAAQGFFAHALGKVDRYTVKYHLTGGAVAPKVDGTSYGLQLEAGYRVRAGALFFEPAASIAVSKGDVDGVQGGAGGMSATFDHTDGAYGRAGLRAGVETVSGTWTLKPYLGAAWEGELRGRPGATLTSGGTSLRFADENEQGRARIEAGIEGGGSRGLSAFAKVEAVTGAKAKGVGGRAGVALRW